ncbi:MAG TPA: isoprenylcysteine carboxylmethyltransferase family protein [Longimicrobiales bacterium]|nr:isoprenylcysteine carboxylmethyltransferase family protein [Longimicrobiales bacterium]
MDTFRYVLAVVIWATIPPAFLYWYLIHPFASYWRTVGPARTYLVVGPICLVVMGMLLRWNGPVRATDLGTNWLLFYSGLGLWIAAALLESRIRKHLDFKTLAGVPELRPRTEVEEPRLLDEGVYARVRHPRYLGFMVGSLGWTMMANHGATYIVAALLVPLVWGLIVLEERELVARFGDRYLDYRARVPALVPRARKA